MYLCRCKVFAVVLVGGVRDAFVRVSIFPKVLKLCAQFLKVTVEIQEGFACRVIIWFVRYQGEVQTTRIFVICPSVDLFFQISIATTMA